MIYRTQFFIIFPFFLMDSYFAVCIPSSTQCGCSPVKPMFSESKIVGGYTARSNSWPWIVSLRRLRENALSTDPGSAFCGGTLINDKYVLTAAHCFSGFTPSDVGNYFAVVGAQYRNDTNPVRLTIKSIIIHNKYDGDTYENDIALLELMYRVSFNDSKIGFICLPPMNKVSYPNTSMNGTAIGWGRLQQGGTASYTLQQVQLPIISYTNQYCHDAIHDDSIQFCAGLIQGGKDTCQGDSGGPLMTYDSSTDTWNMAGITSNGVGCALPENPGVYTRVSMFTDWIKASINGDNTQSQASKQLISTTILFALFCISLLFQK